MVVVAIKKKRKLDQHKYITLLALAVNAEFPKVRFCAIGGEVVKVRDTTLMKSAMFLILTFPKAIALLGYGLIARIAQEPACGETSILQIVKGVSRKGDNNENHYGIQKSDDNRCNAHNIILTIDSL